MTVFSILAGYIIPLNANKNHFKKVCFFFMRFVKAEFEVVQSILLGCCYVGSFIIGAVLLLIVYDFNAFLYLQLDLDYLAYVFWGIMAEMSVSGFVIGAAFLFVSNKKWTSQMENIPWIKSMDLLPKKAAWLVPVVGAFCEEVFFRGFVFLLLINKYPQYGFVIPILVSAALFAIQQMLNTNTLSQAISMAIGSVSVAVIGCLLIMLTGSLLPSLLAHESFVVFYFKQMDNVKYPKKTAYVRRYYN